MSKLEIIKKQLQRKSGASMAQLIKVTGWQAHSIRADLSRMRKSGMPIAKGHNRKGELIYQLQAGGDEQ